MAKILIVDDEPALTAVLRNVLQREHSTVEVAEDGNTALALLRLSAYELVILDIMLPGIDGLKVCETYRSGGGDAAIIMLTAKGSVDDKAAGLDLGADDYLPKPFQLKELLSRVRALLRRSAVRTGTVLAIGTLSLNQRTRTVARGEQTIPLSLKEFELLSFLARHKGVAFTSEQLVERVWRSDTAALPETVRTHIKNLRKKLDIPNARSVVRHVRGYGYMVDAQ
ncbi:MAG: response regulator transcription factor [Candidatus Melainabacteria bacterium]|nr:MAG: response regulator transcription factor [Candidatus Melainabacteria bacterium]